MKDIRIIYQGKIRLIASKVAGINNAAIADYTIYEKLVEEVHLYYLAQPEIGHLGLDMTEMDKLKKPASAALYFNNSNTSVKGLAIWRYKPWNSWTKPIFIRKGSDMPDSDVQFYYWKESDNTYGAAMPLSGNGYRSTLGSDKKNWGSISSSLMNQPDNSSLMNQPDNSRNLSRSESTKSIKEESDHDTKLLNAGSNAAQRSIIPEIAIAFGKDPYELFARIYKVALTQMNRRADLRVNKKMPAVFNYFGWCTYNSVKPGEDRVIAAVKSFTDRQFPVKFVLIDGGWMHSNQHQQLQSFNADPELFPAGFKSMNRRLKSEFGIKYTGIWHTLNGDFEGIDATSELGQRFSKVLFDYSQPVNPSVQNSALTTLHFIQPASDSLYRFYQVWYAWFKNEGFDFTKVDNQLVTERMAKGKYPLFEFSWQLHQALYKASDETFHGALMNCMDMTAEAYLNFGSSAVGRTVEDYFPYKRSETYDLQQGNAAAHVLQAIYNSIYFSQLVYTDFDMFQSHNPNAMIHALARACSNGPVYCTDSTGRQNFAVLRPLVYKDGITIHSSSALLPTEECLFQVQGKQLFKSFSLAGNAGLLFIFNAADTNQVSGNYSVNDIPNFRTKQYIEYEHFSQNWKICNSKDSSKLVLGRLQYRLFQYSPIVDGFSAIGLTDKYNSAATVMSQVYTGKSVLVTLYEGGIFKAYSHMKPRLIQVNKHKITNYFWHNGLLTVSLKGDGHQKLGIYW